MQWTKCHIISREKGKPRQPIRLRAVFCHSHIKGYSFVACYMLKSWSQISQQLVENERPLLDNSYTILWTKTWHNCFGNCNMNCSKCEHSRSFHSCFSIYKKKQKTIHLTKRGGKKRFLVNIWFKISSSLTLWQVIASFVLRL